MQNTMTIVENMKRPEKCLLRVIVINVYFLYGKENIWMTWYWNSQYSHWFLSFYYIEFKKKSFNYFVASVTSQQCQLIYFHPCTDWTLYLPLPAYKDSLVTKNHWQNLQLVEGSLLYSRSRITRLMSVSFR